MIKKSDAGETVINIVKLIDIVYHLCFVITFYIFKIDMTHTTVKVIVIDGILPDLDLDLDEEVGMAPKIILYWTNPAL